MNAAHLKDQAVGRIVVIVVGILALAIALQSLFAFTGSGERRLTDVQKDTMR